jgi:ABC-type transporter Mla maintaining outer membrane lipid asymmetry ATPase subunit MlaF
MVDANARVEALLQVTGLATWAESYPNNVPRNLQQRAGLARALALQPEVLFLDSPLTGLDPPDARWWLNLLGRLAGGHPIMGGRLMTLVVSGDDLRPWQGRARQFAALRDRQFVPLQTDPLASDELLQSLLGQRNADT